MTLGIGGGGDAAATWRFYSWSIVARPGHRCSLQGTPTIRESGTATTWSVASTAANDFVVTRGTIVDRSHAATLDFRWGLDDQGREPSLPEGRRILSVALPHGGGVLSAPDTSRGWTVPPASVDLRHLGHIAAEPIWGAGPPVFDGVFQASYAGSIRQTTLVARPGGALHYQVLLTGPVDPPPGHFGCVGYRAQLVPYDGGAPVATELHELPCATIEGLPVYGRLFDMRIVVPTGARVGSRLVLFWETDTGSSLPAGSSMLVVVR